MRDLLFQELLTLRLLDQDLTGLVEANPIFGLDLFSTRKPEITAVELRNGERVEVFLPYAWASMTAKQRAKWTRRAVRELERQRFQQVLLFWVMMNRKKLAFAARRRRINALLRRFARSLGGPNSVSSELAWFALRPTASASDGTVAMGL